MDISEGGLAVALAESCIQGGKAQKLNLKKGIYEKMYFCLVNLNPELL